MWVETNDGKKEKRVYDSVPDMMNDANKEAKNPNVKKLTLCFPRKKGSKKRR
jgi:hypothetical protein